MKGWQCGELIQFPACLKWREVEIINANIVRDENQTTVI